MTIDRDQLADAMTLSDAFTDGTRAEAMDRNSTQREPFLMFADAALEAMLPDVQEREDRSCAWADYRKEYGVSAAAMAEACKAFFAGWDAARGRLDVGGVLR